MTNAFFRVPPVKYEMLYLIIRVEENISLSWRAYSELELIKKRFPVGKRS
jgi:hypothetical protein